MYQITLEERDYYAILGLPRTASTDEIKQKYRNLSKQFHPDKQAKELQDYANELFHRIERAYQVLSDEQKRAVYDQYGEKGVFILENNSEMVKRDCSVDVINDLIHAVYQRELEAKAGQSGSFTMKVDATSLFEKEKDQLSGMNSMNSMNPMNPFFLPPPPPKSLRSKIHISQLQIVQNVQARISNSQVIAITGMVNSQGMKGFGIANITYQHALSPDQALTLVALMGARSKIAVEISQALTRTLQGSVSLGYGSTGTEVEMRVGQQFSDSLSSAVSVSLGEVAECSLRADYQTNDRHTSAEIFAGGDLGVKVSHLQTINEKAGLRGKAQMVVSASSVEMEGVMIKEISPFSKANYGVVVGLKGVEVKLKYQRGSMNFILPIQLAKSPLNGWAVLTAVVVPVMMAGVEWMRQWWYHGEREAKEKEEVQLREFKNRHAQLAALSQQQMMTPLAIRSRKREETTDGLVILSAIYGQEDVISIPEKVKACEGAMDVTVVLQFMVKDSQLRLYAGSKRELMGFWAREESVQAKEGKELVLQVRYRYRGKVWEVKVKDIEPLYLPAFRAMELGNGTQVE